MILPVFLCLRVGFSIIVGRRHEAVSFNGNISFRSGNFAHAGWHGNGILIPDYPGARDDDNVRDRYAIFAINDRRWCERRRSRRYHGGNYTTQKQLNEIESDDR
jgi:hypothetical protein